VTKMFVESWPFVGVLLMEFLRSVYINQSHTDGPLVSGLYMVVPLHPQLTDSGT